MTFSTAAGRLKTAVEDLVQDGGSGQRWRCARTSWRMIGKIADGPVEPADECRAIDGSMRQDLEGRLNRGYCHMHMTSSRAAAHGAMRL